MNSARTVIVIFLFAYIFYASAQIIQVARTNDAASLQILPESMNVLRSWTEPLAIISATGPYHCGKSFLLNFLNNSTQGFFVGPQAASSTNGLWMQRSDLLAADGSRIIWLDTEGFSSNNVSEIHDAKTFALAALLSSHVLHSSLKVIDQSSVDYVDLIVRRAQLFGLAAGEHVSLGNLTWVVQDFVQEDLDPLVWLRQFTSSAHRDPTLRESDFAMESIFQAVDCTTLPFPTNSVDVLRNLYGYDASIISNGFRTAILRLKNNLLHNTVAKQTSEGTLTGPLLADLLLVLCEAANGNQFPQVPSLWEAWAQARVDAARSSASMGLRKDLNTIAAQTPPLPINAFAAAAAEALMANFNNSKTQMIGFQKRFFASADAIMNELNAILIEEHASQLGRILLYCKVRAKWLASQEILAANITLPTTDVVISNTVDRLKLGLRELIATDLAPYNDTAEFPERLVYCERKADEFAFATRLANQRLLEERALNCIDQEWDRCLAALEAEPKFTNTIRDPGQLERVQRARLERLQANLTQCLGFESESVAFRGARAIVSQNLRRVHDAETEANDKLLALKLHESASFVISSFENELGNFALPSSEENLSELVEAALRSHRAMHVSSGFRDRVTASSTLTFEAALQNLTRALFHANDQRLKESCAHVFPCIERKMRRTGCIVCLAAVVEYFHVQQLRMHAQSCVEASCKLLLSSPKAYSDLLQAWSARFSGPQVVVQAVALLSAMVIALVLLKYASAGNSRRLLRML
eukprot:TRINITY_DN4003_c0_g1_i1.p1 TRINITY_DN4003_c0_g1~~TRINITY_DN4003_c0_g1_i1.p1  ORF type:complete len:759 (-),score=93.19 TRINITY_DN4003_c0_g1_i1:1208-3484(-)